MLSGGSISIPTGAKEPIEIQLFETTGKPLIGSTAIVMQVRRQKDGLYFDWTNNEFRIAALVAQQYEYLSQVDPTYSPGIYHLNTLTHIRGFDTSVITNAELNDIYEVEIHHDTDLDHLYGLPGGFEIKTGGLADKLDDVTTNIVADVWNALQADYTSAGSFGDLMRRVVALQKENYMIDDTAYNANGLLVAGRMRLFPTKTLTDDATAGGDSEGEFATYNVLTEPKAGKPEQADIIRSTREA